MNATFMFYNDADHVGKLAEGMHRQTINGDNVAALETLHLIKEKYGDFVGLRMRLEDAIRELEAAPAPRCCDTACRYFGQLHSTPHQSREDGDF
jgi:Cft2 family RNA processing exonuclease